MCANKVDKRVLQELDYFNCKFESLTRDVEALRLVRNRTNETIMEKERELLNIQRRISGLNEEVMKMLIPKEKDE